MALEPVPASQIPEKKELVLGVAGTSWYNDSLASKIDQVVLSYNRIHPECHITVKEYEEKAVSDFQLELLKGEGPDILLERQSFFDMDDLSAKGAVEDLMPYLAAAEDVSAEDILPGILDLITKNGKIPRIPLSFAVDVMILPEDSDGLYHPAHRACVSRRQRALRHVCGPAQTGSSGWMDQYAPYHRGRR